MPLAQNKVIIEDSASVLDCVDDKSFRLKNLLMKIMVIIKSLVAKVSHQTLSKVTGWRLLLSVTCMM
jgi:hypothetical protein